MVAAIERVAIAPAAAADRHAPVLDHAIGAVGDQLRVEAHDRAAGLDLFGREEAALQLLDGEVHDLAQRRDIGFGRPARGESFPHVSLVARAAHWGSGHGELCRG